MRRKGVGTFIRKGTNTEFIFFHCVFMALLKDQACIKYTDVGNFIKERLR